MHGVTLLGIITVDSDKVTPSLDDRFVCTFLSG